MLFCGRITVPEDVPRSCPPRTPRRHRSSATRASWRAARRRPATRSGCCSSCSTSSLWRAAPWPASCPPPPCPPRPILPSFQYLAEQARVEQAAVALKTWGAQNLVKGHAKCAEGASIDSTALLCVRLVAGRAAGAVASSPCPGLDAQHACVGRRDRGRGRRRRGRGRGQGRRDECAQPRRSAAGRARARRRPVEPSSLTVLFEPKA